MSVDDNDEFWFWDDSTSGPKQDPAKCIGCQKELCAELDSYYFKDTYWSAYCVDCRTKRMPKDKI